MAIIGPEKDIHKTKFNLQICKCNKKGLFPLAISAIWLDNSPISEGSLIVSSDKETGDSAGGKSTFSVLAMLALTRYSDKKRCKHLFWVWHRADMMNRMMSVFIFWSQLGCKDKINKQLLGKVCHSLQWDENQGKGKEMEKKIAHQTPLRWLDHGNGHCEVGGRGV